MLRVWMSTAIMAVLVVAILTARVVLAQEAPDATLTFSGGSVSVGVGYVWADGILTYQGKEYLFLVEGVSIPAVGCSLVSASGNVYHLKNLEDFNGQFMAATAEATVGMGAGATAMRNKQGVVVNFLSMTRGLEFKLATSGVRFTLQK